MLSIGCSRFAAPSSSARWFAVAAGRAAGTADSMTSTTSSSVPFLRLQQRSFQSTCSPQSSLRRCLSAGWTKTTTMVTTTRKWSPRPHASSSVSSLPMVSTQFQPPLTESRVSSCRRSFHTSNTRLLPLRTVQLVSLGEDGEKRDSENSTTTASTGVLKDIIRPANQTVQVGDLLAVVETAATAAAAGNNDTIRTFEIVSPFTGRLTAWHVNEQSTVNLGDDLCSIDVDEQLEQQKQQKDILNQVVAHLRSNNNTIIDKSLMKRFLEIASIDDLRQIANMMIIMHQQHQQQQQQKGVVAGTQLDPLILTIFERMLHLQEKNGKTEDRISTLSDISSVFMQLGDLSQAQSFLEQALVLFEDLEQQQQHKNFATEIAATKLRLAAIIQRGSGDCDKAIEHVQQAQARLESAVVQTESTASAQQQQIQGQLARTYHLLGALFLQKGDFKSAVDAHREGLGRNLELHGVDTAHPNTAVSYQYLADALVQNKEFQAAIQAYQNALQMRRELDKQQHEQQQQQQQGGDSNTATAFVGTVDTARTHASFGQLLAALDEIEAATEQYTAALKICHQLIQQQQQQKEVETNQSQPNLKTGYQILAATIHRRRGAAWYQQRMLEFALKDHERARDLLVDTLGPNHPEVADSHNHVGLAQCQKGEWAKALESHEKALNILVPILGSAEHPHLAATYGALGNAWKGKGDLDEALVQLQKAHELLLKKPSQAQESSTTVGAANNPDVASSHNNLGLLLQEQGKLEEALVEFRAALAIFSSSLGPRHAHTGSCHYNIALTLLQQDQKQQPEAVNDTGATPAAAALAEFEAARDVWLESLGEDHPQTKAVIEAIAGLKKTMKP